ncbi:MAG: response regulator [Lachnospiraceae bacterium]|nr:response regulator [Butyrivibrio sp.]MCM1342455.1 response regulator [Muribaculaceae bacterium]MCM1410239.1 response regulator [Lachnospiraceae bacterium]
MGKTILVIDDDAMNLKRAEFILSKAGYNVLTAASGEEGIAILEKGMADLTLLDIEMPVMNGIQTLRQIRESSAIRESRVMALTASDDEEVRRQMDELGAVGYIRKPFMPPVLQKQVEEALA